jgi:hypothetical protein
MRLEHCLETMAPDLPASSVAGEKELMACSCRPHEYDSEEVQMHDDSCPLAKTPDGFPPSERLYGDWSKVLDQVFTAEIGLDSLFCENKGDDNEQGIAAENLLAECTRLRKKVQRYVELFTPDYRDTRE